MSFNQRSRPFAFLFAANFLVILLLVGWLSGRPLKGAPAAAALGYGFNYQGALDLGGTPANGEFDLRFTLYDSATGGNLIGSPVVLADVAMTQGRFSVMLDFGADAFGPDARWLQIEVKELDRTQYTLLSPRQRISPVPTALWSQAPWRTSGGNLSYTGGKVGIGETAPAWPLHVKAGQAVALLESTAGDYGSVLELRNRTLAISRKFLGAINFNDVEGSYPGQIAYTTTDEMTFRVDGAEQLRLSKDGLTIPATTRFVAIPAAAFIPQHNGHSYSISERGLRYHCSDDICYGQDFIAPVSLPHGATITQLVLVGADTNSSFDMTLNLYRAGWTDLNTSELMASVPSSGSVANLRYFVTENISHAKVDNRFHSYSLVLTIYDGSMAFRSVHITYKVTEPVP